MKKYIKPIIIIVILIVIAMLAYVLTKKNITHYNEGYVNGNTAGNLYNGGMVCEDDGTIFFANPNDNNRLYSMDINGQNLKKLSDDVANYINVDDHYVYYVRNNVGESLDYEFFSFYRNALCRIPRDGGNTLILDTDPCNYATLIGNYIYYLHYDKEDASTLYKVKIDGSDRQQVRKDSPFTCSTSGQYFYYNGTGTSGSILRFDAATDSSIIVYEGNCYKPTVSEDGNGIYYIDGNRNEALVYADLQFNTTEIVTTDSIDSYNIYGDYIYYQKYDKDGSGLCMIKRDGSEYRMIQAGDYKNIQVTSLYVFFTDYHTGTSYYFLRTDPTNVLRFNPSTIKE